jgi:hypothetical protein
MGRPVKGTTEWLDIAVTKIVTEYEDQIGADIGCETASSGEKRKR